MEGAAAVVVSGGVVVAKTVERGAHPTTGGRERAATSMNALDARRINDIYPHLWASAGCSSQVEECVEGEDFIREHEVHGVVGLVGVRRGRAAGRQGAAGRWRR